MMKIYGNKALLAQTARMVSAGREPHSIIIHGEKGLGKKTMAKYIAAQLMCEEHSGIPCGRCRACQLIERGAHPDLIFAQSNDKGNYLVEDIRDSIVGDAPVAPNEGDIKVYVIPDFDLSIQTSIQVQNILLKLIEEPPDHTALILTARSKEAFLTTIISRCVSLSVTPITMQESGEFLQANYPDRSMEEIREALEAGKGNIGRCKAYIEQEQFYNAVGLARQIAQAYAGGSEYGFLKALAGADGKKPLMREALYLFSELLRDACVRLANGDAVGCDTALADSLSRRLTLSSGTEVYDKITKYIRRIDANCSLGLVCNSLCADLF